MRATRSAACFCHTIVRPLCFYGAGAMPAPLYPPTHSQWLQKGGKLGEWKRPEKLKYDAFVVFQIKQATSMFVCLRFRLASRLAPLSPCTTRTTCPETPLGSMGGHRPGGALPPTVLYIRYE